AGTSIAVTAAGALTLASAQAVEGMALSGATIDVGLLAAGATIDLTGTSSVNITTSASTGGVGAITIAAPTITFASLESGAVTLAGGTITGGDVGSDALTGTASGTLTLRDVFTGRLDLTAQDIVVRSVLGGTSGPGHDMSLNATGNITAALIQSGNDLFISAATLDATTLDAVRDLTVAVTDGATLGGVTAFGDVASLATTSLTADAITGSLVEVGTLLTVRSAGDVGLGDVFAGSLDLTAGNLQIANLLTDGAALVRVDGTANLDLASVGQLDYRATTLRFGTLDTLGGAILVGSSVAGDAVNAGTTLSITATDLTATGFAAAGDVTLTVTDTATLGTATSSGGSVFID
ncbi:hypothetical protein, partial [Novosphingobium sp. CCH12-A3]|uniref:hypothetical protein n=1 Tax=Novosphingobium sp. CCH12-A3 TaxID=1768752 RepID=UPI000A51CC44